VVVETLRSSEGDDYRYISRRGYTEICWHSRLLGAPRQPQVHLVGFMVIRNVVRVPPSQSSLQRCWVAFVIVVRLQWKGLNVGFSISSSQHDVRTWLPLLIHFVGQAALW